jgi:CheY-like chemotaxis protein
VNNAELRSFIKGFGRQMRLQLSALFSALELAESDSSSRPEALELARDKAQKLLELSQDLEFLNELQSSPPEQREFHLSELGIDLREKFLPEAQRAGMQLEIETVFGKGLPWLGSIARLDKVIDRLLNSAFAESDGPHHLRIEIVDDQPQPELSLSLTSPSTTQSDIKCTSHKLAQSMIETVDGWIDERDNSGETRCLRFGIPISSVTRAADAWHLPAKVLVAEDDRVFAKVLFKILRSLGCNVSVVGDGRNAIRLVQEERPDIVFLDWEMPGCSGLEAARVLRAEMGDETPHLIAMTANTSLQDRQACLDAGMDEFLAKPFKKQEIALIIQNFLQQR